MIRSGNTLKEAGLILVSALLLGLVSNYFLEKGLFAVDQPPSLSHEVVPPAYADYAEVHEAYDAGNAILIDARSSYDYDLGHIKGAVNLPLKEFDDRKQQIAAWERDALLITYCDGEECNSSLELAEKLAQAGFTNVRFFFGGWKEWQEQGGETVTR